MASNSNESAPPKSTNQSPRSSRRFQLPLQDSNATLQPLLALEAPLDSDTIVVSRPDPTDQYSSPYASEISHPTSAAAANPSTNTTLAAISERVNQILAPVYALGLNQSCKNTVQCDAMGSSTSREVVDATPASMTRLTASAPAMSNPARTGGRRGRGPRRRGTLLAHNSIAIDAGVALTAPTTPLSRRGSSSARGRPRGSGRAARRPSTRGGKRKRPGGDDGDGKNGADSDSSENFTSLPTQSRSGRKIFQSAASAGSPVIKIEDDNGSPPPRGALLRVPASRHQNQQQQGSRRGAGSRGRRGGAAVNGHPRRTPGGASAVCENCGRGHSPVANAIVFCDGCNLPWHQFCHDPPIGREVVLVAESEWFCADCVVRREERARLQGRVPGESMSLVEVRGAFEALYMEDVCANLVVQKRQYLRKLPPEDLVSLLLHATALHPNLPIFAPKGATSATNASGAVEENYEVEDTLLPYPKAGNGIRLPPESEDLSILLDDDTGAFSHRWEGIEALIYSSSSTSLEGKRNALDGGALRVSTWGAVM